jgi:hypothetical protein
MSKIKEQIELNDKTLIGLEKVYEKLIEFKKENNSELVIIVDNQIKKIKFPKNDK